MAHADPQPGWATRALLDAQDAYEIRQCQDGYNYKAINHMVDASVATTIRVQARRRYMRSGQPALS